MRIVAGEAKGFRLTAPEGTTARPTSDRVREAVFNALHSLGAVVDATVLDLYAGSGALGIEALSRGATHTTFVERDRHAVAAIESNLDRTGFGPSAAVVRSDALKFLGGSAGRFDLALVDPPYADDRWSELLDLLDAGLVVAESDREIDGGPRWHVVRARRYGGTVVTMLQPAAGTTRA